MILVNGFRVSLLSAPKPLYSRTYLLVKANCIKLIFRRMAEGTSQLDIVPNVDIEDGKFKYVLIKVYDSKSGEKKSKYIVRGYKWAGYHSDIYEQVEDKLLKMGLKSECVGGGRIFHDAEQKSILVYGYSQGYGKADHAISTDLLKKHFETYSDITWSNEGY